MYYSYDFFNGFVVYMVLFCFVVNNIVCSGL